MCDCIWFCIGVCDGKCKCEKYLSVNSDEGYALANKWEQTVKDALIPVRIEFAAANNFVKVNSNE